MINDQCLKIVPIHNKIVLHDMQRKQKPFQDLVNKFIKAFAKQRIKEIQKVDKENHLEVINLYHIDCMFKAVCANSSKLYRMMSWCMDLYPRHDYSIFLKIMFLLSHAIKFSDIKVPFQELNSNQEDFMNGQEQTSQTTANSSGQLKLYIEELRQLAKTLPTRELSLVLRTVPLNSSIIGNNVFEQIHKLIEDRPIMDRFMIGVMLYRLNGDETIFQLIENYNKTQPYKFSVDILRQKHQHYASKHPKNAIKNGKFINYYKKQCEKQIQALLKNDNYSLTGSFTFNSDIAATMQYVAFQSFEANQYIKAHHYFSMSLQFTDENWDFINYNIVLCLMKLNCFQQAEKIIANMIDKNQQIQMLDKAANLNLYVSILRKNKNYQQALKKLKLSQKSFTWAYRSAIKFRIQVCTSFDPKQPQTQDDCRQMIFKNKIVTFPQQENSFSINYFQRGAILYDILQQKINNTNMKIQQNIWDQQILEESIESLLTYIQINPMRQVRPYMYLVKVYIMKKLYHTAVYYFRLIQQQLLTNKKHDIQEFIDFTQKVALNEKYFPEKIDCQRILKQLNIKAKSVVLNRMQVAKKFMKQDFFKSALITLLSIRDYQSISYHINMSQYHSRILYCFVELEEMQKAKQYFFNNIRTFQLIISKYNVNFMQQISLEIKNREMALKILKKIDGNQKYNTYLNHLIKFMLEEVSFFQNDNAMLLCQTNFQYQLIIQQERLITSFFQKLSSLLENNQFKGDVQKINKQIRINQILINEIISNMNPEQDISPKLLIKSGIYLETTYLPAAMICFNQAIRIFSLNDSFQIFQQFQAILKRLNIKKDLFILIGKQIQAQNIKYQSLKQYNINQSKYIERLCKLWEQYLSLEYQLNFLTINYQKDQHSCKVLKNSLKVDKKRNPKLKIKTILLISKRFKSLKQLEQFMKQAIRIAPQFEIYKLWKQFHEENLVDQDLWSQQLLQLQQIKSKSKLFITFQHENQYDFVNGFVSWMIDQKDKNNKYKLSYPQSKDFINKCVQLLSKKSKRYEIISILTLLFEKKFSSKQVNLKGLQKISILLKEFDKNKKKILQQKICQKLFNPQTQQLFIEQIRKTVPDIK